jgi:hypothetical protein
MSLQRQRPGMRTPWHPTADIGESVPYVISRTVRLCRQMTGGDGERFCRCSGLVENPIRLSDYTSADLDLAGASRASEDLASGTLLDGDGAAQ